MRARVTLGVWACLLLAACQQARSLECDGLVCPPGLVCAPNGERCVLAEQITACKDARDGALCTLSGLSSGKCVAGLCEGANCGNGVLDPGEKCDDANTQDGDGCSADCQSDELCGNGRVDAVRGEQCDDGNTESGDGCQADCRLPRCGDGAVDEGETCDDFNRVDGDGCSADCLSDESCGNGMLDTAVGEQCDDGNVLDADGCQATCRLPRCGDGVQDADEVCDDGNRVDGDGCSADCTSDESCGNGIFDPQAGEGCDCGSDPDRLPIGCSEINSEAPTASCRSGCVRPSCGDGIRDETEQCDGSDLAGATCSDYGFYDATSLGCTKLCTFDTSACTGFCGDEIRNGGEQCDGSDVGALDCTTFGYYDAPGLACNGICTVDVSACQGYCGDGIVNGPEACDGEPPNDVCMDYGFDYGPIGCSGVCQRGFAGCAYLGWKREQLNTTAGGTSVWGSAADDLFVAAGSTGVMHFDGSAWHEMVLPQSPSSSKPGVLWGSGPGDVFGAGWGGTILHYDGTSWSQQDSGTTSERFQGISGSGLGDVFAVAYSGAIYHDDGSGWSPQDSGNSNELIGVWASGPKDAYAVGANKTVLHFDGMNWSPVPGPWTALVTNGSFQAVWGRGPKDVYITGFTTFHYDGNGWTQLTPGAPGFITSLWGTSSDLFVAGDVGVIMHYDGKSWSRMTTHVNATLWSVWASPEGSAFAVGTGGTALRLTGVDLGPSGASNVGTAKINRIWLAAPNDGFGVGAGGAIYHFDGASWTAMTSGTTEALQDVWGSGPGDVFAVGNNGTVRHYDGMSWSTVMTGSTGNLLSVWGSGPKDVFIGDASGSASLHYDGMTWSSSAVLFGGPTAMWGDASDDVFCVASLSFGHYDGKSWKSLATGSRQFSAIWGSGPRDVFAGAYGGGIYHWDGSTLSPMVTGTGLSIRSLWGSGPRDVFASGEGGLLLHFDGDRWSPIRTPTSEIYVAGASHGKTSLMVSLTSGRTERSWRETGTTCDACPTGGACNPRVDLPCNITVAGSTLGYQDSQQTYPCGDPADTGPARYYRVVAPRTGSITVKLSRLSADLDLVALATDAREACNTAADGCLAASSNAGLLDEEVTFAASAGAAYYLAVGSKSTSGSYFLDVSCE